MSITIIVLAFLVLPLAVMFLPSANTKHPKKEILLLTVKDKERQQIQAIPSPKAGQ